LSESFARAIFGPAKQHIRVLRDLGIGKTKIPTETVRTPRPIPLQSWRKALTCSVLRTKVSIHANRPYPLNYKGNYAMEFILKVKRLTEDATLPSYAHPGDAGLDLFSCHDSVIEPGKVSLVKTGLSIELPPDTEAQVRPKSGLAIKNNVTVLNTPGTIDEGYRGEVGIILINHGAIPFVIKKGMKIAQMVIKPIIRVRVSEVQTLQDSQRGEGGFGSTGL